MKYLENKNYLEFGYLSTKQTNYLAVIMKMQLQMRKIKQDLLDFLFDLIEKLASEMNKDIENLIIMVFQISNSIERK